jgi:CO/xanthine dehydrogenase Mo-binding subunit
VEKSPFVDDILIKHCYTGILLRSPVVSGFLKEIQTPKLPFNVSLITAADIPGKNSLAWPENPGVSTDVPIFPEKELSYYGQAVALLAGPNPAKLREIAGQCTVITENAGDAGVHGGSTSGKLLIERHYNTGEIEAAFEKALSIVEGTYSADFQDPWSSDPPGAIALMQKAPEGPDSTMIIHTATQWPGHVKNSVARVLNIKTGAVEVHVSRLEIHLDSKVWIPSLLACQAALGARICNKPVKLVLKRDEDFLFSPKSVQAEIHIQSALGSRGQVLGSKVKITANLGSFGIFADEIIDRLALGALGAYSHGSLALHAQACSSPIAPAGPMAGFGMAQGFFAAERHASRIADTLGEDPSEWRKNFFLRKGGKLSIGIDIREEAPLEELLDTAATLSDYHRKWAANELLRKNRRENPTQWRNINESLRGIGISLAYQGSSLLYNSQLPGSKTEGGVELTLEKDGSLEIKTSLPCTDNQIQPWKVLASKILGVEELRIVSPAGETGKTIPESGPACLSRSIGLITRLVEKACMAIRKQRFRDPLPITVHRYYHTAKTQAWGQFLCDENALSPLSWGSAVVEVEIDPVEYVPRIQGIWIALEGGTILVEDRARKSIACNALQALSWAMREKTRYREGKIDSPIRDYPVPRMEELIPIGIDFLWSEGNPKGIGELPFNTIPAAYAQAISQALDYPFQKYPVSSGDIWRAVQDLSSAGTSPPGSAGARFPSGEQE